MTRRMSKLLGIIVGVHIQVACVVVVSRSMLDMAVLLFPHGPNDLVHIGKRPSGRYAVMIGSLKTDFPGMTGAVDLSTWPADFVTDFALNFQVRTSMVMNARPAPWFATQTRLSLSTLPKPFMSR